MLIYRDFTFDAAHVLDGYSEDHPYGRIHGHSFRARVWIQGEPLKENNMILPLLKKRNPYVEYVFSKNKLIKMLSA